MSSFKKLFTILILVLTISTSAVLFVGHYTKNRGEQITIKHNVERFGYVNIYIRENLDDDPRRFVQRLRYPVAVYNRNQLPLNSPFIDFQLPMRILTHRATQQTVAFLPNGRIYLFPKLYNVYGRVFSLGELLASGYASFLKDSFDRSAVVDLSTMFYSRSLGGQDIPKINRRTGAFTSGINTNSRSVFSSNFQRTPKYVRKPIYQEQNTYDNQLTSYKTRNPYNRKPPSDNEKPASQEFIPMPEGAKSIPSAARPMPEGTRQIPDGAVPTPQQAVVAPEAAITTPQAALVAPGAAVVAPEAAVVAPQALFPIPTRRPTTTTSRPTTTTRRPTTTTARLTTTTSRPTTTTARPTTTTSRPTTTTARPTTTTSRPTTTTARPTTTTSQPTTTTSRPTTTTARPTTTTSQSTTTTSQSTTSTSGSTILTSQSILTQCNPAGTTNAANIGKRSVEGNGPTRSKMQPVPSSITDSDLLPNTYLVEFSIDANIRDPFQTVTNSLMASHGIAKSTIQQRRTIQSPLFCGVSFTMADNDSTDALETIQEVVAIYPVFIVQVPKLIITEVPLDISNNNSTETINSHNLTDITEVHNALHNFGQGVRVALIDTGIYYKHPALGGCFGPGCKVAFGYDFVGDSYGSPNYIAVPDNDPLDNCSTESHGTHVAGIVAGNTTGITQTVFTPYIPFIGVAPQVTLGAYRVFGCNGSAGTDVITAAIYRAHDDNADIISLSLGNAEPYPESSDTVAIQRVTDAGVYVTISMGNDGAGGLQTGSSPAVSPNAIAVASVDSTLNLLLLIFAPNGSKIMYQPGAAFGGWTKTVNSTIVVNNVSAVASDGCSGPSKTVTGLVVLFYYTSGDSCNSATRCNLAATAGATGCLLYNVGAITGSSGIPSGSISLQDGLNIVGIVAASPSAIFTFTGMPEVAVSQTGGTPSYFTSYGLTGDLWLKPQISGIGGNVYSTISLFAAQSQKLTTAYATYSGTSMATPYIAGALALFLASIGNPSSNTSTGNASNGICRPTFSVATNVFQSTAVPVNIYNTSLFATAAQQGAGLVNAYQALTTTVIFSPSQLSLNDTLRTATSYTVNLWNIGSTTDTYQLTHNGAALATGKAANQDQLLTTPLFSAGYAVVNFSPNKCTLAPGTKCAITLTFNAPAAANPALLPIYSGFIYATNTVSGQVVHLSYAGVVGNYSSARILAQDFSATYTTGIYNSNWNYAFGNSQTPSLSASTGFYVVVVLVWSTRLLFVEVVSTQDANLSTFNVSLGVVYSTSSAQAFYWSNVPKTIATATGQDFSQYLYLFWNGRVCPKSVGETCTSQQSTKLSTGTYKLRFSALNHFGNAQNPADYDIYRTSSFTLTN